MEADWPLIAVRFALYVTLSGLFGLSAFSLYGLKAGERADALALRPWLVGSGLLGLLFSGIALALLAAAMAGAPPWPIDREAIGMLLSGSATGTAWEARMVALVVASIAALIAARTRGSARHGGARCGRSRSRRSPGQGTARWTRARPAGCIWWPIFSTCLAAGAWVGALLGLTLLVAAAGRPRRRRPSRP